MANGGATHEGFRIAWRQTARNSMTLPKFWVPIWQLAFIFYFLALIPSEVIPLPKKKPGDLNGSARKQTSHILEITRSRGNTWQAAPEPWMLELFWEAAVWNHSIIQLVTGRSLCTVAECENSTSFIYFMKIFLTKQPDETITSLRFGSLGTRPTNHWYFLIVYLNPDTSAGAWDHLQSEKCCHRGKCDLLQILQKVKSLFLRIMWCTIIKRSTTCTNPITTTAVHMTLTSSSCLLGCTSACKQRGLSIFLTL